MILIFLKPSVTEITLPISTHIFFYRTRVRSLFTLVTNSLTHSLTHSCEDTNSKLFDVVTDADVDDEDRVGNSLLQISKLRFGQKAKLLFRL